MRAFHFTFSLFAVTTIRSQTTDHVLAIGQTGTCIVRHNGAHCWGQPDHIDPSWKRGESTAPITSPPLNTLDFGPNFDVRSVTLGQNVSCALSTDGFARCWGPKGMSFGDGNALRFDDANNFGKNINLGKQFAIMDDAGSGCGDGDVCFMSSLKRVKCLGAASFGQLGYGDNKTRGNSPGDLGDNLPEVALGKQSFSKIAVGSNHVCAISADNSKLKCWGQNEFGNLGLGDTVDRGNKIGQMGDNLTFTDLGFSSPFVLNAVSTGGHHSCALIASSTGNEVKCWGMIRGLLSFLTKSLYF